MSAIFLSLLFVWFLLVSIALVLTFLASLFLVLGSGSGDGKEAGVAGPSGIDNGDVGNTTVVSVSDDEEEEDDQDHDSPDLLSVSSRFTAVLGHLGYEHGQLLDVKLERTIEAFEADLKQGRLPRLGTLKRARDVELDTEINTVTENIDGLLHLAHGSEESKRLLYGRPMKRRKDAWYENVKIKREF